MKNPTTLLIRLLADSAALNVCPSSEAAAEAGELSPLRAADIVSSKAARIVACAACLLIVLSLSLSSFLWFVLSKAKLFRASSAAAPEPAATVKS